VVVVVAVVNLVLGNLIKVLLAMPGLLKELQGRAKAAVTEPVVVVVVAVKMVVLADQCVVATMVHLAVKMATVWLPAAALYLVVHMVVVAE
jgi:hypothetical protein